MQKVYIQTDSLSSGINMTNTQTCVCKSALKNSFTLRETFYQENTNSMHC